MSNVEQLVEPLLHSPHLPVAVELLQRQMADENKRRQRFYEETTPEQKVEFIDGEVVLHSPACNRHLDVTKHVLKLLDTYVSLNQLGTVKAEKCLCVFPRNDYEPDVVFFGLERAAALDPDTLKFPVPDLAVEVLSDSTEKRDRGVKFEDYAANGVREYWIIDSETGVLEQYLADEDGAYRLELKSSTGKVRSDVIAGLELKIEAIFDEAANLRALRDIM